MATTRCNRTCPSLSSTKPSIPVERTYRRCHQAAVRTGEAYSFKGDFHPPPTLEWSAHADHWLWLSVMARSGAHDFVDRDRNRSIGHCLPDQVGRTDR